MVCMFLKVQHSDIYIILISYVVFFIIACIYESEYLTSFMVVHFLIKLMFLLHIVKIKRKWKKVQVHQSIYMR